MRRRTHWARPLSLMLSLALAFSLAAIPALAEELPPPEQEPAAVVEEPPQDTGSEILVPDEDTGEEKITENTEQTPGQPSDEGMEELLAQPAPPEEPAVPPQAGQENEQPQTEPGPEEDEEEPAAPAESEETGGGNADMPSAPVPPQAERAPEAPLAEPENRAERYPLKLYVEGDEGGTITTDPAGEAEVGQEVTVTVTPAEGYELDSLTFINGDGGDSDAVVGGKFVMPAANVTVMASFRRIPNGELSVSILEPTGKGSVTADKTQGLSEGDKIQLTVTPDQDYELAELSVKTATGKTVALNADNSFLMPLESVTVSATFTQRVPAENTYTLTLVSGENGTISAAKTTGLLPGDEVRIEVEPEEGYKLETLTAVDVQGNEIELKDASFAMPASNVTVTASFTELKIYGIKEGESASWTKGSSEVLVVSSWADFDLPTTSIYMDGELVPGEDSEGRSNYVLSEGSTKASFQPHYLETLAVGTHKVEIVTKDGKAGTTITIQAKGAEPAPQPQPQPGDTGSTEGKTETKAEDSGKTAVTPLNAAAPAPAPAAAPITPVTRTAASAPATGDTTGMGFWLMAALLSGAGLVFGFKKQHG